MFAAKNLLGKVTMHIREFHIRHQFHNCIKPRLNGMLRARIIPYRGLEKADHPAIIVCCNREAAVASWD